MSPLDPFSLAPRKGHRGHSPHFPALIKVHAAPGLELMRRAWLGREEEEGGGVAAVQWYLLQLIKVSEAQGAFLFPGFLLPPA